MKVEKFELLGKPVEGNEITIAYVTMYLFIGCLLPISKF